MLGGDTKINRVIASCKTIEQAKCAVVYLELSVRAKIISEVRAVYWGGVLSGIAHANNWQ